MKVVVLVEEKHAKFIRAVEEECDRVAKKGRHLRSHHEASALLQEEIEEAWEIVKLKPEKRNYKAYRAELVQIASLAMRSSVELKDVHE